MATSRVHGETAASIAKFNAPISLFPHHAHSCSAKKSCLDLQFVGAGRWPAGLQGGPQRGDKAAQQRKCTFLSGWTGCPLRKWH